MREIILAVVAGLLGGFIIAVQMTANIADAPDQSVRYAPNPVSK